MEGDAKTKGSCGFKKNETDKIHPTLDLQRKVDLMPMGPKAREQAGKLQMLAIYSQTCTPNEGSQTPSIALLIQKPRRQCTSKPDVNLAVIHRSKTDQNVSSVDYPSGHSTLLLLRVNDFQSPNCAIEK